MVTSPLLTFGAIALRIVIAWEFQSEEILKWSNYLGILLIVIVHTILIKIGIGLLKGNPFYPNIAPTRRKKVFKILTVLVTIFLILFGVGGLAYGITRVPYRYYDAGPYLTLHNDQNPDTGITVCWHTTVSTDSTVRFGRSSAILNESASSEMQGEYHFVRIDNLQPDTYYFYEVVGQDFGIKSFKTAPLPGTSANFTFVLWADPRTNNGLETALGGPNLPAYMQAELDRTNTDLAFSIVTGDIVSEGPTFESWALYLQDITTDNFSANAFNIDAMGNHEHHRDPQLENFRNFYPYETGNFSFVYGQVFVLVLDSFDYEGEEWRDVNFPEEQKEWAAAELEAHSNYPFKIITMHQSPINYGNFSYGGHHGNISQAIFDLCNDYGVDAFFCGHSHHYEVSLLNNTHYMMVGIGGNANRGNWEYDGEINDVTDAGGEILAAGGEDTGWLRIDVTEDQMNIRPLMIDGTEYPGFILNATDNPDT